MDVAAANETIPSGERIPEREAAQLTIELGKSFWGDRYDNADCLGVIANYETNHWRAARYKEDPKPYDRAISEQIERSQAVIEPYIGRQVVGHTSTLAMHANDGWEEWRIPSPFFAEGIIKGVEGHPTLVRNFWEYGGDGVTEVAPNLRRVSYRIGVALDPIADKPVRTNARITDTELPQTDALLVPIREFPKSTTWFHHLFSSQLK